MNVVANRRWFQFRVSSLLWLTTVIALSIVFVWERRERQRLELVIKQMEAAIEEFSLQDIKASAARARIDRHFEREMKRKMSILYPTSEATKEDVGPDTDIASGPHDRP